MKSKCTSWPMMAAPFMMFGMAKLMKNMMEACNSSEALTIDSSCWAMQSACQDTKTTKDSWEAFDAPVVPASGPDGNIVDLAGAAGMFNTLVATLKAADLTETLQGEGPFTVFAPTDEAFAALPEGTQEDLLKPQNKEKLQAILTYHVVPGLLQAADLIRQQNVVTVNGKELTVGLKINQATLTQADINATNGVIHVIDTVLLPK